MRPKFLLLAACVVAFASARAETPVRPFDGNSWWAHIRVLADDNMEGRQTGSDGLRRAFGVNPIADPEPLRNSFVHSDQYSFIRRGVPAVKLDYGAEPGTPEHKVYKDWLTNRYHAPSEDLNQPIDLGAAALYEEIIRALPIETANHEARPQWKPDSFFRRYATK